LVCCHVFTWYICWRMSTTKCAMHHISLICDKCHNAKFGIFELLV